VRKSTAVASALAMVAAGLVLSAASPASAVPGGNCAADYQEKEINWQPNKWRVGAMCASLNADSKARGVGVVSTGPDHFTAYFTQLNSWKWSSWGLGAIDVDKVEIRRV